MSHKSWSPSSVGWAYQWLTMSVWGGVAEPAAVLGGEWWCSNLCMFHWQPVSRDRLWSHFQSKHLVIVSCWAAAVVLEERCCGHGWGCSHHPQISCRFVDWLSISWFARCPVCTRPYMWVLIGRFFDTVFRYKHLALVLLIVESWKLAVVKNLCTEPCSWIVQTSQLPRQLIVILVFLSFLSKNKVWREISNHLEIDSELCGQ